MARTISVELVGDATSLERAFRRSSTAGKQWERTANQTFRGAIAGSGAFRGLGRQVAFAAGSFIGAAGFTKVLTDSIREASEAAKVQRQLAAQFRANRQELKPYQRQIDETSTRLSQLAGIQDEEFTAAFTAAFRGTKDVTAALKVETVAADVAKGRNVELSTAAIALTKAYLGQTTALRRLGIQIPKNVTGMEALDLVGRRFAGQAAAGTTAQERLSVALAETEESIGRALLPTVEKYTSKLNDWLGKEENQKRIQQDVDKGVKVLDVGVRVLSKSVEIATSKWNPFVDVVIGVNEAVKALQKTASKGIPGITGPVGTPKPTFPGGKPPGVTGPAGKVPAPPGPLGLRARFSNLEVALAQAGITGSEADDRRVLQQMAANLKRQLATRKLTFKERNALRTDLAKIEGDIAAIDQRAADQAKQVRDKQIKAKQEELDAEKDREKKLREKHREMIRRQRQQVADAKSAIRSAIDTIRGQIGSLFQGPILNPDPDARKRALGVPGPQASTLAADLQAQVAQFKRFQGDLRKLGKAGAPAGLIAELQSMGPSALPQVEALLAGSARDRGAFFTAFRAREKAARDLAIAQTNVKVEVYIDGVRVMPKKVRTTRSAQTRGRNPGARPNPGAVLP